jgi:hypothetical protein
VKLRQDASGKFFVECPLPDCSKLHLLKRNRNYKDKPQLRFRCSACGTTWYATEAERNAIVEAYSKPVEKKQKKEKSKPKDEKPPQDPPREMSWFEKIVL